MHACNCMQDIPGSDFVCQGPLCHKIVRHNLSMDEASLRITVGCDMASAAACLAFMADQFSTDIAQ